MKRVLFLISFLFVIGCAHSVHVYNVSDYEDFKGPAQAKSIVAQSEQFVVLGITQDVHYAEKVWDDLQAQCTKGSITGIQTKFSTSLGFFSWTNKIKMQGYCIE